MYRTQIHKYFQITVPGKAVCDLYVLLCNTGYLYSCKLAVLWRILKSDTLFLSDDLQRRVTVSFWTDWKILLYFSLPPFTFSLCFVINLYTLADLSGTIDATSLHFVITYQLSISLRTLPTYQFLQAFATIKKRQKLIFFLSHCYFCTNFKKGKFKLTSVSLSIYNYVRAST